MTASELDLIGEPPSPEKKPARQPLMFTIPAGTPAVRCRSYPKCQAFVHWVVYQTKGKDGTPVKTSRIPVVATKEPTATEGGHGSSHFIGCVDAQKWRKR